MIHEFYAVTETSVYLVKDEMEDGAPIVEKIALNKRSAVEVGGRLKSGSKVGITKQIFLYFPEEDGEIMDPDEVKFYDWGGNTSSLRALFTDRHMALSCHEEPDKKKLDPRWREETMAVLEAVGPDHPTFKLGSRFLEELASDPQLTG